MSYPTFFGGLGRGISGGVLCVLLLMGMFYSHGFGFVLDLDGFFSLLFTLDVVPLFYISNAVVHILN